MNLKHFEERRTERGYGKKGFIFEGERIFSFYFLTDTEVVFTEECDGHYYTVLTPKAAIEAFQEAIQIIKDHQAKD